MATISLSTAQATRYTVEHLGHEVWSTTDYDAAQRELKAVNDSPLGTCVDCGEQFPMILIDRSGSSRPCPAEEGKEGVKYGHRVPREDYEAWRVTTEEAARARVAEFVRQWELRESQRDYQHTVYSVHYDANRDDGATLTIDDLKLLLKGV